MAMKQPRVTYYQDAQEKWRWRYQSVNGEILADSGQGYVRREDAVRGFGRVLLGGDAQVVIHHPDHEDPETSTTGPESEEDSTDE